MSDVKRYTWSTEDHAMRESAELGDHVRLADYDKLAAELAAEKHDNGLLFGQACDRIKEQEARIATLVAALRAVSREGGYGYQGCQSCRENMATADAALSGARTADGKGDENG